LPHSGSDQRLLNESAYPGNTNHEQCPNSPEILSAEEAVCIDNVLTMDSPHLKSNPDSIDISSEMTASLHCQAGSSPPVESNNSVNVGTNYVGPLPEQNLIIDRLSPVHSICQEDNTTVDLGYDIEMKDNRLVANFGAVSGCSGIDVSELSASFCKSDDVGKSFSKTQEKRPPSNRSDKEDRETFQNLSDTEDQSTDFPNIVAECKHPISCDTDYVDDRPLQDVSENRNLHMSATTVTKHPEELPDNTQQIDSLAAGSEGWPVRFTADFGGLEGAAPQMEEFTSDWGAATQGDVSTAAGDDSEEEFGDFDDASFVAAAPSSAVMTEEKFEVSYTGILLLNLFFTPPHERFTVISTFTGTFF